MYFDVFCVFQWAPHHNTATITHSKPSHPSLPKERSEKSIKAEKIASIPSTVLSHSSKFLNSGGGEKKNESRMSYLGFVFYLVSDRYVFFPPPHFCFLSPPLFARRKKRKKPPSHARLGLCTKRCTVTRGLCISNVRNFFCHH